MSTHRHTLALAAAALLFGVAAMGAPARIAITDPPDGAVFPPDMAPPLFVWLDPVASNRFWRVTISFGNGAPAIDLAARVQPFKIGEIDFRSLGPTNEAPQLTPQQAASRTWRPPESVWGQVRRHAVQRPARIAIRGYRLAGGDPSSAAAIEIRIARHPVGAPIFYRDVPLMPSDVEPGVIKPLAPDALPLVAWRLREVDVARSRLLLEGLHTCANCHSFSRDGRTLGIDVDGPANDRGAYAIAPVQPETVIRSADVISWNRFPGKPRGEKTIGFMSQVSPCGRWVVSTVNESVYVANFKDFRFLQVFYPTRGILAWYDRWTGRMEALPGADDPRYAHANAAWSPDGQYLIFARATARDPYPEGRPLARAANDPDELPMRYDLYRIPFREGRGGAPEPVLGASANGMSNSFPKVTPDGRWIVYVQARNGMLMRPDGQLYIVPFWGGVARRMRCNTPLMNSWHSFSPNGRWMVFTSKSRSPYTQMFLTYIDEDGNDSPAILIENATAANRAVNLPEFVNAAAGGIQRIKVPAAEFFELVNRARGLEAEGNFSGAVTEWRRALRLAPHDAGALTGLGRALARAGQTEEAKRRLQEAVALDPENAEAWNNLGVLLAGEGRQEEAMRHYRRALGARPNFAQAHYNLGRLLLRAGKLEEAIGHWRKAAELSPQSAEVCNNLATLLAASGKLDEAIEAWRRAVRADPALKEAHLGLGTALFHRGRFAEALSHWRAGLAVEPPDIKALNLAARLLATHPDAGLRDGAEAVRYAERANRAVEGRDPEILETLAAAYAETGRFAEAVTALQRAMELVRAEQSGHLAAKLALYKEGRVWRDPAWMRP